MELTANARTVLEARYLRRENGQIVETPEELFRRVARNIAAVDGEVYGKDPGQVRELEDRFYRFMTQREFMPNSPTLMNAGLPLQQLSACFVLPVEDSLEGIFETLKAAALIHQSGGGTGFAFSRLRPQGDPVRTSGGVASGPVSFMKVFDAATHSIKQGGKRRGANMGILRVDHPDILQFITCKASGTEVTNFNISVAITDAFMDALERDDAYDLINPRDGRVVGQLRAREVWDLIAENAWLNGDPGVIFIDRINRENPNRHAEVIEATNPCGEQPLPPYGSCNLGSINLALFVREPFTERAQVDWERLRETTWLAVHFLDNVIDANRYPLPQIREKSLQDRRIGLGVMGWADMLVQLGIPYDSEDAIAQAHEVMGFIEDEAIKASVALAEERGVYPLWEGSMWEERGLRVRNATLTTIAPTGTISIIAGASSGIEPFFSLAFTRHVLDGKTLKEVNPLLVEVLQQRGLWTEELAERIAEQGSVEGLEGIPEDLQRIFITAHQITPEWHIRMQAAFQAHTHSAVSKTVNFPNSATVEDVKEVYRLAWELGCKGVTIYRDGSRQGQVLTVGTKGSAESEKDGAAPDGVGRKVNGSWGQIRPIPRPARLYGITDARQTPLGKLFLTLNLMDGHPIELFAQIGKAGSDVTAFTEAIARLVSLALRSGIEPFFSLAFTRHVL
ncbi:MAG: vitamin B12-dependent ribonucleotide reductase, partial [Firmicutes bacterium]|nr:vitamin B12-dependent ribonucleotide reductase [Bacillota bacterium]